MCYITSYLHVEVVRIDCCFQSYTSYSQVSSYHPGSPQHFYLPGWETAVIKRLFNTSYLFGTEQKKAIILILHQGRYVSIHESRFIIPRYEETLSNVISTLFGIILLLLIQRETNTYYLWCGRGFFWNIIFDRAISKTCTHWMLRHFESMRLLIYAR